MTIDLDGLRSRVTLSDFIGRYVELRKEGTEFKCRSPFTNEKTPSFCVNDAKQRWFCFSSGKTGDVFDFVTETQHCTLPEAAEVVAQYVGGEVPKLNGMLKPAPAPRPEAEAEAWWNANAERRESQSQRYLG